jgi:hypothetical protein
MQTVFQPGSASEKPHIPTTKAAITANGHASAKFGADEANASPNAKAAHTINHFLSVISSHLVARRTIYQIPRKVLLHETNSNTFAQKRNLNEES